MEVHAGTIFHSHPLLFSGTHVKTTSHIQAVKFLSIEKVRGGNCRAWFLCGDRIFIQMDQTIEIEKQLNQLLSCQPLDFPDRVAKKLAQIKTLSKQTRTLEKELKELKKVQEVTPKDVKS